jgi:UMF1 family MFS transporter
LSPLPHARRREVLAWAFYDWANSAFATVVIAGFFPLFFKGYWSAGVDATVSSFRLGVANSVESLIVLLAAPLLGAVADQGALKKPLLLAFTALGVAATAGLALVGEGAWTLAVAFYVVAGVGFAASNVFYDALLVDVSDPADFDRVSALGYALGYLGGGVVLLACVALTRWPEAFGLAGPAQAVRAAFVLTALWWAAFSLPLARAVRQRYAVAALPLGAAVRGGLRQLARTARRLRLHRPAALFLAAYWLYIDGVDTIVRMAVDYGLALGFPPEQLIIALLVVQFVGFPAALAFGWLGARLGPKTGILVAIGAYAAITLWGYRLTAVWEFYGVAVAIGLFQGGIQSLSRSLYARLIPPEEAGEFFGFYNLMGKFAAVIGPALMGTVALATGDSRASILSLLVLFGGGAAILLAVDDRATSAPSPGSDPGRAPSDAAAPR